MVKVDQSLENFVAAVLADLSPGNSLWRIDPDFPAKVRRALLRYRDVQVSNGLACRGRTGWYGLLRPYSRSTLLARLLAGGDPVRLPPPLRFGQPSYELVQSDRVALQDVRCLPGGLIQIDGDTYSRQAKNEDARLVEAALAQGVTSDGCLQAGPSFLAAMSGNPEWCVRLARDASWRSPRSPWPAWTLHVGSREAGVAMPYALEAITENTKRGRVFLREAQSCWGPALVVTSPADVHAGRFRLFTRLGWLLSRSEEWASEDPMFKSVACVPEKMEAMGEPTLA